VCLIIVYNYFGADIAQNSFENILLSSRHSSQLMWHYYKLYGYLFDVSRA